MIAFVAPDPGDYRPTRVPKPEERVARLHRLPHPRRGPRRSASPSRTLTPLQGLTVTVDAGGAPVTVDVRQMHCWPQRTGWRSRQWYMTPELLLPCADGKKTVPYQRGRAAGGRLRSAAEQTQGFWITLSAPAEAKPGQYEATVTISSAGKQPLRLPLSDRGAALQARSARRTAPGCCTPTPAAGAT